MQRTGPLWKTPTLSIAAGALLYEYGTRVFIDEERVHYKAKRDSAHVSWSAVAGFVPARLRSGLGSLGPSAASGARRSAWTRRKLWRLWHPRACFCVQSIRVVSAPNVTVFYRIWTMDVYDDAPHTRTKTGVWCFDKLCMVNTERHPDLTFDRIGSAKRG